MAMAKKCQVIYLEQRQDKDMNKKEKKFDFNYFCFVIL